MYGDLEHLFHSQLHNCAVQTIDGYSGLSLLEMNMDDDDGAWWRLG